MKQDETITVRASDGDGNSRTNTYQIAAGSPLRGFTHDANGNMTSDGSKTYVWDAENRLVEVATDRARDAADVQEGQERSPEPQDEQAAA